MKLNSKDKAILILQIRNHKTLKAIGQEAIAIILSKSKRRSKIRIIKLNQTLIKLPIQHQLIKIDNMIVKFDINMYFIFK